MDKNKNCTKLVLQDHQMTNFVLFTSVFTICISIYIYTKAESENINFSVSVAYLGNDDLFC